MRRYTRRQMLQLTGGVVGAAALAPLATRVVRAQEVPTGQTARFWWWGEQELPASRPG